MTDDNAEDDGLKSLRAMWLSMPDEDPPDRGFAELMAAARVKADEMASTKPSLWQRFVDTFRRPPVLALATITVLFGGAVLLAQRGDQMEVQAPAATQPAAEERESAPAAPQAVTPDPATAAPSVAPPAEPSTNEEAPAKPSAAEPAAPIRAERPSRRRSPSKQMSSGRTAAPAEDGVQAESTSLLEDEADEKKADKKAAPSSTVGGAAGGASAPTVAAPTPSQLRDRARAAAARGDCETAKTLARRIEKQDAAYYAAKVAPDAALAACLKR